MIRGTLLLLKAGPRWTCDTEQARWQRVPQRPFDEARGAPEVRVRNVTGMRAVSGCGRFGVASTVPRSRRPGALCSTGQLLRVCGVSVLRGLRFVHGQGTPIHESAVQHRTGAAAAAAAGAQQVEFNSCGPKLCTAVIHGASLGAVAMVGVDGYDQREPRRSGRRWRRWLRATATGTKAG